MTTWDPKQYRRFAAERFRPGYELMERISAVPRSLVDLGCGTGELTVELCRRYPSAVSVGVDMSSAMLKKAECLSSHVKWTEGDLECWEADRSYDLVFTNAALQWVANHDALIPRLVSIVAQGGTFAMQVPANFEAKSHQLLYESAIDLGISLKDRRASVLSADRYLDHLSAHFDDVDVWCTEYVHLLSGDDAVLEWVRGTALRPILSELGEPQLSQFLEMYRQKLRIAYPRGDDGATRFPFRRLFAVGRGKKA